MTRKENTKQKMNKTGVSPSGKATDSDSVIPWVQILPPQPNEESCVITQLSFFIIIGIYQTTLKKIMTVFPYNPSKSNPLSISGIPIYYRYRQWYKHHDP